MNLAEQAAKLAARGFAVFPCRPGDKRPAVNEWEQRAIADPERVARYWPSPRHNIGIACGPSGLVVIDLDMPKDGKEMPPEWADKDGVNDGADVFAYLSEKAGVLEWPTTYTAMTPSRGTHFYYRAIEGREIRNSAGKIGPMVDVRAAGGYVVAAGSVTPAGTYIDFGPAEVEPLPQWLAERADPPPPPKPQYVAQEFTGEAGRATRMLGLVREVVNAPASQGNSLLHWASCRAGEMVAAGEIDQAKAEEILLDAAMHGGRRTEKEARATITSGIRGAR
ncbi:bifunctional DNA primase/polymerase [Spirillospora sp. CA-142024]|uniref:bifunctional DNA primase/polymerase n=1 Tax=Spirillospora sp. CA-142024 TaxID=3240036 RepID=UPI003D8BDC16